jgi:hypothetical protein
VATGKNPVGGKSTQTTAPPADDPAKVANPEADDQSKPVAARNPFAKDETSTAHTATTPPAPNSPNDPPVNPNDPESTIGTEGDGPFRTSADLYPSAVAPLAMVHQDYPDGRAKMIEALLDEREGYARLGDKKKDRLAAVDESLAALGTTYEEARQARQDRRERVERGEPDPNLPDPNLKMIVALAEEREGYVNNDQPDRVAAVDESLRRLGSSPERAAELRKQHQDRTQAPQHTDRTATQQTR